MSKSFMLRWSIALIPVLAIGSSFSHYWYFTQLTNIYY